MEKGFSDTRRFIGDGLYKGLKETLKHLLFQRPITIQYPKEKRTDIAPRYRGALAMEDYLGKPRLDNKLVIEAKEMPPCMDACPANVNARGYISLIALGKYREAYNLHLESNPFPSTCGRICPHPCEDACKRGEMKDNPVSIMALKRFMADKEFELAKKEGASASFSELRNQRSEKVVIIGAGPSGLSCAYYLTKWGYKVIILEKNKVAGGMLRIGVPDYRLPQLILEREIKRIESLGVQIKYGFSVGKDISLEELKNQCDVVLIAVGLSDSRSLPIDGIDAEGVLLAIPFLRACSRKEQLEIGGKVLVIGGGNVAVDVARSARRLKPSAEITMISLESGKEMPARTWEIEEALEEKIAIKNCMGPKKVEVKGNRVKGMRFITCASVFNKEGRFDPTFIEDEKHYLEADTIIIAIGQQSNLAFLPDDLLDKGRLVYDYETAKVTDDGIFACGEVAKGPGSTVAAIAGGRKAAVLIHNYLANDKVTDIKRTAKIELKKLYNEGIRVQIPKIEVEERISNFEEVEKPLTEEQARKEAERCLSCMTGICIGCGICAEMCPANAITIEASQDHKSRQVNKYVIDFGKCIFCGICSEACPTKTIHHTIQYELSEYSPGDLNYDLTRLAQMQEKEKEGKLNDTYYRN